MYKSLQKPVEGAAADKVLRVNQMSEFDVDDGVEVHFCSFFVFNSGARCEQ